MDKYNGPEAYKPLTPWQYFGLEVLYSIPVVGLVFLIIHACSNVNMNRKNFAKSYFCVLVLAIILVIISAVTGVFAQPVA